MKEEIFGIWPPYEAFYIEAMLFCSISALRSLDIIADWIESLPNIDSEKLFDNISEDDILNNLQNVVIQGAALSRYCWPSRQGENNEHKLRGEQIREALEMTDESPLKNRDLRNELEHFDEKLDSYLSNGVVGNIFPKYIGPLPDKPEVPTHIFRAYYTNVGIFELLGKRYSIQPIADEIARIHQSLENFSQSGYRMKIV
jgi:hypothetical protein